LLVCGGSARFAADRHGRAARPASERLRQPAATPKGCSIRELQAPESRFLPGTIGPDHRPAPSAAERGRDDPSPTGRWPAAAVRGAQHTVRAGPQRCPRQIVEGPARTGPRTAAVERDRPSPAGGGSVEDLPAVLRRDAVPRDRGVHHPRRQARVGHEPDKPTVRTPSSPTFARATPDRRRQNAFVPDTRRRGRPLIAEPTQGAAHGAVAQLGAPVSKHTPVAAAQAGRYLAQPLAALDRRVADEIHRACAAAPPATISRLGRRRNPERIGHLVGPAHHHAGTGGHPGPAGYAVVQTGAGRHLAYDRRRAGRGAPSAGAGVGRRGPSPPSVRAANEAPLVNWGTEEARDEPHRSRAATGAGWPGPGHKSPNTYSGERGEELAKTV